MTVTAFPTRSKRCDTRALEIVRAEVVSDLKRSKNKGSWRAAALGALEFAVRLYIATAWAFAIIFMAALPMAVTGWLFYLAFHWKG